MMLLGGGTGMKGSTWIGPDKNGKSGGNPKLMAIKIEKMMFFQNMFVYKLKLEDFAVCPVSCP